MCYRQLFERKCNKYRSIRLSILLCSLRENIVRLMSRLANPRDIIMESGCKINFMVVVNIFLRMVLITRESLGTVWRVKVDIFIIMVVFMKER